MTHGACRSAAFCLHTRPYRESSAILQLFTRDFGKISAVQRGARSVSRRGRTSVAQPFVVLQVEWFGARELKTIGKLEVETTPRVLRGNALFAGLYLNELLNAVLPEQQEHRLLYDAYEETLARLTNESSLEVSLRQFERWLLEELGYAIPFHAVDREGHHAGDLQSSAYYVYVPESGFRLCDERSGVGHSERFSGEHLLRIAAQTLESPEVLLAAKHLMRQALSVLLGHKSLNSRQLFV